MKEPRICVIIRNDDNLTNTLECLESLANVSYSHFTCLIVDHLANSHAALEIRFKHPQTLICHTESKNDSAAYNFGIAWALSKPFSWILLLSNAVGVDPHVLTAFMTQAKASPDAKIFGPKILRHEDPMRIDHLGGIWDAIQGKPTSIEGRELDKAPFTKSQTVDYVSLEALLMHRSVPETIGLLEPRYHRLWADIDYCFRARRKGFLVHTAPQAKIWRKLPAHSKQSALEHDNFWWHGRLLWIERNLPHAQRRDLCKRVIRPEIRKIIRDNLSNAIRRLLCRRISLEEADKRGRLRSALVGIVDYYLNRD